MVFRSVLRPSTGTGFIAGEVTAVPEDATRMDEDARAMLWLLSGAWATQALPTAAQLGLADHLREGPRTASQLARLAGADHDSLRVLVAYATASRDHAGWARAAAGYRIYFVPSAAGTEVSPALVRRLMALVDERTATELERSLDVGRTGGALTRDARERIIRALDDCSYGLSELRDIVAVERTARQRDV